MQQDIAGSRDQACRAHLSGLQQVLSLRKSLGITSSFGAEMWHSVAMKTVRSMFDYGSIERSADSADSNVYR